VDGDRAPAGRKSRRAIASSATDEPYLRVATVGTTAGGPSTEN